MLYLNAYRVSRAFGGREEGGWYFDAGEPIASIPIKTEVSPGQTYLVTLERTVKTIPCDFCEGTGFVRCEDGDMARLLRADQALQRGNAAPHLARRAGQSDHEDSR
jgi:hypothetical protein